MRIPVKYGLVLALVHFILSACIVLLGRSDPDNLMLFFIVDFPIMMVVDSLAVTWLFELMSVPGDSGVTPFIVLGTLFYLTVGVCLGLVVSRLRQNRSIPPGGCRECGYNLTGNESGICPECGTAIRTAG